jgi:hypothetical protein
MNNGRELRFEWNDIVKQYPILDTMIPYFIPPKTLSIHNPTDKELSLLDCINVLGVVNRECGNTFNNVIVKRVMGEDALTYKETIQFLKEEFNATISKD